MPTYVYKFIDTGETIEVQQAFSDDTLTEAEHPTSGKTMPVKKVFLPVGVTFKGGGFYKTDSRNGSSASKVNTSAGSAGSSDSSTSSSGGSDSSSSSSSSDSSSTSKGTGSSTPASTPSSSSSSTSSSSSASSSD